MLREYLLGVWYEAEELNQRAIISLLEPGIDTVLDLGCNDGSFTERIAGEIGARNALGVEIDTDRARTARDRGITVTEADLERPLPLEDETADAITVNQVIEHLKNTDNMISEAMRLLRPGGLLVISTENLSSWHNIFSIILGWQPFSLTNISDRRMGIGNPLALHRGNTGVSRYMQHRRVFSPRGLAELIEIHGFQVESLKGAGYFPLGGRPARALNAIDTRHSSFMTIRGRKPA
ncbi:MAG: class I SAM-dependent methyltransferase [Actinobacteria bacterium]|nr:class I SAM-dependent methyltransferase [Actinomycetota bacterium]MCG2819988.1 class I SAM-dependent methyltransferase [Actinomycetes bacterium]MBU4178518.1 class I SAM-dependent methyltransferase [Actinomycetota bacterium]MBU4219225.1 class I SAM-dependent methyltransferase [Actinomycetota bacterium]MBU4359481.1 class I SAM-dependent methyltransferase [Actinomycetota bacterium]